MKPRFITHFAMPVAAIVLAQAPLQAATTTFLTDPFAGSTALTTPGRQVVATNEITLSSFNTTTDVFAFDQTIFGLSGGPLSFVNSFAGSLADGRYNVIVLRDTDNDANPATPFNAGAAANLIASVIDTPGDGFFIYWNSALNVNRLVYSTDLSENTADLSVLARIASPTGLDAINELPNFTTSNFAVVPEPSSALMGAVAALALLRRKRH